MVSQCYDWIAILAALFIALVVNVGLTVCQESVEDEDEVLVALSQELGNFIHYVGGPSWAHVLLSPLENLAAIEEPVVRNKVSCSSFKVSSSGILLLTL